MEFRLATLEDAGNFSRLHMRSATRQPGAFMPRLGRCFLWQYYRTVLAEPGTVGVCAIHEGKMVGFVFGCLNAERRMRSLRRRRVRLGIAALPALLREPSLFRKALARAYAGPSGHNGYIVENGAREEFWAWEAPRQAGALDLHLKWLEIMKQLGATTVRGEVDLLNKQVVQTHRMLGARLSAAIFNSSEGFCRRWISSRTADSNVSGRPTGYQPHRPPSSLPSRRAATVLFGQDCSGTRLSRVDERVAQ